MAVTFDHPLRPVPLLTPLDEKLRLLRESGMDRVEVLPFTETLRQMTAREFMRQVLREQLGVAVLLTGYDHRFGHNRAEGFDDYVRYGHELGIEVRSLPPAPAEGLGSNVSSSAIRELLLSGEVGTAAQWLGRPYSLTGLVVHGEHVGTDLGFPTANIVPANADQLVPANGAYAVSVTVGDSRFKGMMNIGWRPTFNGRQQTLEVHVFQLHQDLYGQSLRVEFVRRLRAERRFPTKESLIEQLKKDAIDAQQ
jgi:riboflavin kinase/FMN adenylyltransferase